MLLKCWEWFKYQIERNIKMNNYQLYARVLRLFTDFEEYCRICGMQSGQDADGMRNIVRNVIYPDHSLVWC